MSDVDHDPETGRAGEDADRRRGKTCPLTGRDRGPIVLGVLLILIGLVFLVAQWIPPVREWLGLLSWGRGWPLIIVGVGVLQLVIGLTQGTPGMAVPFAVLTGIGGLLYWNNLTGNWASWAYLWTLIPGFVGVGTLLAGILGEKRRRSLRQGGNLIFTSLILLAVFGSLLGGPRLFGPYWPVLLIALGLWILLQGAYHRRLDRP